MRATGTRCANNQDVLLALSVFLSLKCESERKGDIPYLLLRRFLPILIGQHGRAVRRHGIRQWKPSFYIAQQRIVEIHMALQSHRKRNDMTSQIEAQFEVFAKIETE